MSKSTAAKQEIATIRITNNIVHVDFAYHGRTLKPDAMPVLQDDIDQILSRLREEINKFSDNGISCGSSLFD